MLNGPTDEPNAIVDAGKANKAPKRFFRRFIVRAVRRPPLRHPIS